MQFIDLKAQYAALKDEINANIQAVLDSAQFIGGPQVKQLEKELADFVGRKHCVTCANGTDALQIAYMVAGVGAGDAVFCPDMTFISSTEPAKMFGATSVFCDITRDTYTLCPESLEKQIKAVLAEGKLKPKAVVAVDILGNPCDYDAIAPICEKYGLILIEDAAQAFGASNKGRKCCSFGTIATTSFFPAKPLGCYGDGGAVFTDNAEWAALLASYRVHGKGTDKYDNVRIGMNSRLDTLQAAVLSVKLRAFAHYELDRVNAVAAAYSRRLQGKVPTPQVPEGYLSSWAQYTVLMPSEAERTRVQQVLREQGIPTMVYYPRTMHAQTAFAHVAQPLDCEAFAATQLCRRVLSLPMHPYLTDEEVDTVASALIAAL